jgi:preprotein translocase subunit SecB
MIPISPLQLKRHAFANISLRALRQGSAQAQATLDQKVQCVPDAKKPNCWHLGLTIKIGSASPEKPFLYEGEIQVVGEVEMHDTFPAEKREQVARVNGISLLYSAAREMVLNLSARSTHGPLTLPVLNFAEFFAQADRAAAAPAKARPGKAQPPG